LCLTKYLLISILQYENIYIVIVPNINMMAYIRSKKIKGKIYYYVVEGSLIKGKVKQKVLRYLGNVENILKVFRFYKEHK